MSERSDHLPYGVEHWAAESMQAGSDQSALMRGHIVRTQVRFWLFVAAFIGVCALGLVLEIIRHLMGGMSISAWRCLGGLIPGLVGLIAVLGTSAAFVRQVYDIPDWRPALGYAWLLLFGRAPLSLLDLMPSGIPLAPYPSIAVQQGMIDEKHRDSPLAHLGGPGNVMVFHDSAAFLERFGRFTRIAGPGWIFLRRFERIREVLDLRPQERSYVVTALTKDGIPVQTDVQVRFQLARPTADLVPPTPDIPHPASAYEWALTRAGQCQVRSVDLDSGAEQILHWSDQVGVGGAMRAMIAEYRLDELLEPYEPDRDPRREISQRLCDKVREAARRLGVEVLEVRMGALEPTLEEVREERIASWQTSWRSRARKEEAIGLAEGIRERGLARAYAQMEIIRSLAREFQDAVERDVALPAEIIILRFMEALRHIWSRPGGAFASSQEVFNMWRSLQRDLKKWVGPAYLLPEGKAEANEPHDGGE